jgi:hypothetical protein
VIRLGTGGVAAVLGLCSLKLASEAVVIVRGRFRVVLLETADEYYRKKL